MTLLTAVKRCRIGTTGWAIAAIAVCSCGAAPSRDAQISTAASAPHGRGTISGTVEDDGCRSQPCPSARPPLPLVARVTARTTGGPHPGAIAAATTSDRQGRFTLKVPAGIYRLRARPRLSGPRCEAPRVRVHSQRITRVLVACG